MLETTARLKWMWRWFSIVNLIIYVPCTQRSTFHVLHPPFPSKMFSFYRLMTSILAIFKHFLNYQWLCPPSPLSHLTKTCQLNVLLMCRGLLFFHRVVNVSPLSPLNFEETIRCDDRRRRWWLAHTTRHNCLDCFICPAFSRHTHTHASCNHLYSTVKEEEEK